MKNFIYILLIAPLFFISSCDKGPIHGCLDSQACNYNPEATLDNNSCEYALQGYDCDGIWTGPLVGMEDEGGIVFYVDETGQHGLVASMGDLGDFEWGCYIEDVNGADGTAIGTGYQNTMDIVSQECSTEDGGMAAAQAALDAEINGYSDWYLPSRDELTEMYNTIGKGGSEGNIGGFENTYYWSSSEYDNFIYAWYVYFLNGNSDYFPKYYTYRVRVIRAF